MEIWNNGIDKIKEKFGVVSSFNLDSFVSSTEEIENKKESYKLIWGSNKSKTFSMNFVDYDYFKIGVAKFRPIIRGFLALLIIFYNINQALNTFGLSIGFSNAMSGSSGSKNDGKGE